MKPLPYNDLYSERRESAEALSKRVHLRSL